MLLKNGWYQVRFYRDRRSHPGLNRGNEFSC